MEKEKKLCYNKNMKEYLIDVFWDEETERWGAINDEIPIALESDSFDHLIERVRLATPELVTLNGHGSSPYVLNFHAERQLKAII